MDKADIYFFIGIIISTFLGIPTINKWLRNIKIYSASKKISKIEEQINTITKLSKNTETFIAQMFVNIFLVLILIIVSVFMSKLIFQDTYQIISFILFFTLYMLTLLQAGKSFELACQMRNPKDSIEQLTRQIDLIRDKNKL